MSSSATASNSTATSTSSSGDGNTNRVRLNSSDIPRTYSGLYGEGGDTGDLLPFELANNCNTDWLTKGGFSLLITYLSLILLGELFLLAFSPLNVSWTVTNLVHGIVTLTYLHWIKGSPNFYEQGEMNAMTLWEQLDAQPYNSKWVRRTLMVVPTVLTHIACHFSHYQPLFSLINVSMWLVVIVAKLPFMHGVRILGINRTTGIDDEVQQDELKRR